MQTYHVSPSFLTAEDLTQEETTEIPTLAGLDLQVWGSSFLSQDSSWLPTALEQ